MGFVCRQKICQKSTLNRVFFGIFASSNGLSCSGVKAGLDLELKYITKITSIIGMGPTKENTEVKVNRPRATRHGPPDLFIEHFDF